MIHLRAARIPKAAWLRRGSFSNPRLVRVTRGGEWAYYQLYP